MLNNKKLFSNLFKIVTKFPTLTFLIIFSLVVAIFNPQFMSYSNFFNILRQAAVNAIVAAGMTFVILTGGIDLSVGSILAFSGAVLAKLIVHGAYEVYAIILLLLTGAFLGLLNGFIICKGKVQPFIATLAMMILLRGATLVFTDGSPITFSSNFELHILDAIGSGYFLGIPLSVYIMLLVFVIGYFILRYMKIGRYIYAVGCNEKATYIAGINTNIVKIFAYTVCGITAAISGLIATTRLFSAQPTMGSSYELDAIAAVVIGGTPLSGGRGSIVGTLIGALIISVLNNALNILNVSSYYQMVVKGLVILVAVILDRKNI